MRICSKTNKPLSLATNDRLSIDLKKKDSIHSRTPLVCLSLEGTLFKKVFRHEIITSSEISYLNTITFSYVENSNELSCTILLRPGVTELLTKLSQSVDYMIYSSETDSFIQAAMDAIAQSEAEQNADNEDLCELIFDAMSNVHFWSIDQCIYKEGLFFKSLGSLAEFAEKSINDIWIIDDKPDQIDFSSHALSVSTFNGDLQDKELVRIIHQIFI